MVFKPCALFPPVATGGGGGVVGDTTHGPNNRLVILQLQFSGQNTSKESKNVRNVKWNGSTYRKLLIQLYLKGIE